MIFSSEQDSTARSLAFSSSVYEDEDLQDIRASMERLLQEDGDLIRSSPEFGAGDFNGNPPEVRELFSRLAAEMDEDSSRMAVDNEEDNDDEEDEEDEEGAEGDEEEEDDEEEEECSNGSPGDEEQSNNGRLNEEWHSGTSFFLSFYEMLTTCLAKFTLQLLDPSLANRWQRRGPECRGGVSRQHFQSTGGASLQPGAADGL